MAQESHQDSSVGLPFAVTGSKTGQVEGRVENFFIENKKKAWGDFLKG